MTGIDGPTIVAERQEIVKTLKSLITEHSLPLWSGEGWDPAAGGFVEKLDSEGSGVQARSILLLRQRRLGCIPQMGVRVADLCSHRSLNMKMTKAFAFGILYCTLAGLAHADQPIQPAVQALRCDTFLSSLGVNTHLDQGYNPGSYVLPLRYLGVRNIRDGGRNLSGHLMLHAQTGVRVDLVGTDVIDLTAQQGSWPEPTRCLRSRDRTNLTIFRSHTTDDRAGEPPLTGFRVGFWAAYRAGLAGFRSPSFKEIFTAR
jgi:hypothetical protein